MATGSSISCSLSISDFNEVATACENVCHEWEELAKHINIDRVTVLSIQRERSGHSLIWCLNQLLTIWLRQPSPTQPKPSWRILRDAVARVDRPLSETIWTKHISNCDLCRADTILSDGDTRLQQQQALVVRTPLHTLRHTPVAKAVQKQNAVEAAKELKKDFKELVDFLITEISTINVDQLRYRISDHFEEEEGTVDEELEKHLTKIEDYNKPGAILNYFRRHRFIGYINYSLVKVFQQLAKSPLLDKRIEQYENDYQCFLELSLSQIHEAFHQCADLRPDYPAGIPKFTIHLQSHWEGKSMLDLKEFLNQCFTNSSCIGQLMIAKIIRNCIIVTFAVLPHIAREVLRYLTNDDIIMSMMTEGISVDVSKQLMKYKEVFDTPSMEKAPGTLLGLKTDPTSYNSQAILAIKHDFDDTVTVTDLTGIYGDIETNEYSRLGELKGDASVMETADIYERVVNILQKRIPSLEIQLVTHKQMMMELESTRDELKTTKEALRIVESDMESQLVTHKQIMMELGNTKDKLKMTNQGLSIVVQEADQSSVKCKEENPAEGQLFLGLEEDGIQQQTEAKLSQKNPENSHGQPNPLKRMWKFLKKNRTTDEESNQSNPELSQIIELSQIRKPPTTDSREKMSLSYSDSYKPEPINHELLKLLDMITVYTRERINCGLFNLDFLILKCLRELIESICNTEEIDIDIQTADTLEKAYLILHERSIRQRGTSQQQPSITLNKNKIQMDGEEKGNTIQLDGDTQRDREKRANILTDGEKKGNIIQLDRDFVSTRWQTDGKRKIQLD